METDKQLHEVDLVDVLMHRAADGKPIFVTGSGAKYLCVSDTACKVAEQASLKTGLSTKVIQLVELPEIAKAEG